MYFKLALGNVRKSARDFAIYFVTLALGVAIFYAFNSISGQATGFKEAGAITIGEVKRILQGLTVFLTVVMGFLMVYANNYLLRRRKKELGLYQLLGMRRRQVSVVLTLETLLASVGSVVVGLLVGVLLSQLMTVVTAAIFKAHISGFSFQFSPDAAFLTLRCFVAIFVVMLILNLVTLRKVRLSELMGAARANETIKVRSLPATIVLGVLGIGCIVVSYVRLLHDGIPLVTDSDPVAFYITTALMLVGTFSFFYAFSGILLHVGRLMRNHYFRGLNMFTLRQLSARVNTLSTSMAVVSLILFLAITSVGTGMGMATAMNRGFEIVAPYDASVIAKYSYQDASDALSAANILEGLKEKGVDLSSIASGTATRTEYDCTSIDGGDGVNYPNVAKSAGVELPDEIEEGLKSIDASVLLPSFTYVSESDYNASRKLLGLSPVSLNNEYLFATPSTKETKTFYEEAMKKGFKLTINGVTLSPSAAGLDNSPSAVAGNSDHLAEGTVEVIVPDSLLKDARPVKTVLNMKYSVSQSEGDAFAAAHFPQSKDQGSWLILEGSVDSGTYASAELSLTKTEATSGSTGVTGLFAYISVYIGFVLVIACAAIMAIQQLSTASDSAPSYLLLSELGAPHKMAMGSLLRQVLVFFALPLLIGILHSVIALSQMLSTVEKLAGGGLLPVISGVIAAFVLIYAVYFVITYFMARGIVSVKAKR